MTSEDQIVGAVFGDNEDSAKAVDHVFAVLAATYGAAWDRSLGAAPIGDTKTAWAFHMGNFTHSQTAKRRILWALKNPQDRVPSAIDFRNLCRAAPSASEMPELLPLAQDPSIVAVIVSGIKAKAPGESGPKQWAHHLKARHARGEQLNRNQIWSYKVALGMVA